MKNELVENSSNIIIELNKEMSATFEKKIAAKMKVAARIDEARNALNWSKQDLAKELKKSPSEITKWLSGTHNFTIDTIVEIEDILKINLLSLEESKSKVVYQFKETSNNLFITAETKGSLYYILSKAKMSRSKSSFISQKDFIGIKI